MDFRTLLDMGVQVAPIGVKIRKKRNLYVRKRPRNVVPMPCGDASVVAQFIRFHVLIRVFDGDADAWLDHVREHGGEEDLRFARWIRSRLRQDPMLLMSIRRMVDATPFWRAS